MYYQEFKLQWSFCDHYDYAQTPASWKLLLNLAICKNDHGTVDGTSMPGLKNSCFEFSVEKIGTRHSSCGPCHEYTSFLPSPVLFLLLMWALYYVVLIQSLEACLTTWNQKLSSIFLWWMGRKLILQQGRNDFIVAALSKTGLRSSNLQWSKLKRSRQEAGKMPFIVSSSSLKSYSVC